MNRRFLHIIPVPVEAWNSDNRWYGFIEEVPFVAADKHGRGTSLAIGLAASRSVRARQTLADDRGCQLSHSQERALKNLVGYLLHSECR